MRASSIMIVGTSSDVGKSVLCTALCRIFSNEGYRVAPFKSQNMALNSYVTSKGEEIGRAQGVQAEAARVEPTTTMNPILLKPKHEMVSEVIVHGKPYKAMKATTYREDFAMNALSIVEQSIRELENSYDLIVAEGAGSPVEINLKDRDIVNMRVAKMLDADVFLVADIDRGGVFASIVGTLDLLDEDERKLVKGIIINKFRGMRELLDDGIKWLEEKTGIPVVGVIPYLDIEIEAEDSLALESLKLKSPKNHESLIDVACIQLPRIANFTDLDPLFNEPEVGVRFIKNKNELKQPDVIVLPSTENPMDDIKWLEQTGIMDEIKRCYEKGSKIFGIGGGYQLLGQSLIDPNNEEISGLSLLPIETIFTNENHASKIKGKINSDLFQHEIFVEGYELYLGTSKLRSNSEVQPFLYVKDGSVEGLVVEQGKIIGTYLHGIFQNRSFTRAYFNEIRLLKGVKPLSMEVESESERREKAYDILAKHVRKYLDMDYVYSILDEQKKVKGSLS